MTREEMIKTLEDVLYNLNEIRQNYNYSTKQDAVQLAEQGFWRLRELYDDLTKDQETTS